MSLLPSCLLITVLAWTNPKKAVGLAKAARQDEIMEGKTAEAVPALHEWDLSLIHI